MGWPTRIVCLTEETTETLYRIGAGELVVGVSGFTVRPPEAREKPKVSSFLDANFERILELKPDLVLGFSDLQPGVAALTDGVAQLQRIVAAVARGEKLPAPRPGDLRSAQ